MRNIVCITLITLCFNVQAQKKELRKIDKLVLESFWEEAKDELDTSKSLILSSEDKYKAQLTAVGLFQLILINFPVKLMPMVLKILLEKLSRT